MILGISATASLNEHFEDCIKRPYISEGIQKLTKPPLESIEDLAKSGANGPAPLRRLPVRHLPVMLPEHSRGVVGFSEPTAALLVARR